MCDGRGVKVALYARFSDADLQQAKSCEEQLEAGRAMARGNGYTIVEECVDQGVRASNWSGRTGWARVMTLAEKGEIERVIVWQISRFARELAKAFSVLDALRDHGVDLQDVDGRVYDLGDVAGQALLFGTALGAEQYTKQLAATMKRAMRARAKEGKLSTGTEPYGYKLEYDTMQRNGKWVSCNPRPVIDEPKADLVRRMFKLYAEGTPRTGIMRALNREGIPAPRGGRWLVPTITAMLANPRYIGRRIHGKTVRTGRKVHTISGRRQAVKADEAEWVVTENYCEPLVDLAMWEVVQAKLKADQAAYHAKAEEHPLTQPASRFMLRGFVFCGLCGSKCEVYKARDYRAYRCVGRRLRTCPGGTPTQTRDLDGWVRFVLETVCSDPEALADILRDGSEHANAANAALDLRLEGMREELAKLESGQANLIAAVKAGGDVAVLVAALRDSAAELETLKEAITKAEGARIVTQSASLTAYLTGNAPRFTGDLEHDRELLSKLVGRVIIGVDAVSLELKTGETETSRPEDVQQVAAVLPDVEQAGWEHARMPDRNDGQTSPTGFRAVITAKLPLTGKDWVCGRATRGAFPGRLFVAK